MEISRQNTSLIGLYFVRRFKLATSHYNYYLNKNANLRYGKAFENLNGAEADQVAIDTIKCVGRINHNMTRRVNMVGELLKSLFGITMAMSLYQVGNAPRWKAELGRQAISWAGALVGGEFGTSVGALVGPMESIIAGIGGGILGSIGADALATFSFDISLIMRAERLLEVTRVFMGLSSPSSGTKIAI
ncbi:uncharacterized protein F4822DRAFT_398329 [Hypoxylon trugodes]|uniref:uncharacterized protein n=1 Tax=Hypoxylon trugodes TaxID=326681 RepID=UPI00218CBEFD|nr:uncharacterized protein F4822DRAFT_398329 [Hypoxylon trugodes]KAI1389446.1 hypothetical protein F4822DRAFT_398329 [Hypoxylon trugodes]